MNYSWIQIINIICHYHLVKNNKIIGGWEKCDYLYFKLFPILYNMIKKEKHIIMLIDTVLITLHHLSTPTHINQAVSSLSSSQFHLELMWWFHYYLQRETFESIIIWASSWCTNFWKMKCCQRQYNITMFTQIKPLQAFHPPNLTCDLCDLVIPWRKNESHLNNASITVGFKSLISSISSWIDVKLLQPSKK